MHSSASLLWLVSTGQFCPSPALMAKVSLCQNVLSMSAVITDHVLSSNHITSCLSSNKARRNEVTFKAVCIEAHLEYACTSIVAAAATHTQTACVYELQ